MSDITVEQTIEAGAVAIESCRWHHTLLANDGGPMWTDRDLAQAAYDAMLPLIRKQLADEVRAEKGAGNEFRDTVLERAARLIEGVAG